MATLRARDVLTDLREHVKDARLHGERDSHPVVSDGDSNLAPILADMERDRATQRRVLRRIAENVANRLRETGLVAIHPQGVRRHVDAQLMLAVIDKRP